VPIGYADGLPRSLSNLGWFIVNGERSPIRGRVCMDQAVVGLSKQATVGDEVSVIGDGSEGTMTFDDVARLDGTINYEIATRLTARVPRVYYRSGEPVGWEDPILGESEGG
jgi:alanine racemase